MRTTINNEELKAKLLSNIKLLDVREADEFMSGHIPGAINLPLSQIAEQFSQLDREEHYYIICASGVRTKKAAIFLAQKGFGITPVNGGMMTWTGELVR